MTSKKQAIAITEAHPYPVLGSDQRALQIIKETLGPENLADLDRIAVPSGGGQQWSYRHQGNEVSAASLQGIMLYYTGARRLFVGKYGEGETKPPVCYSNDGRRGVGDPGGACSECPYAEFNNELGKTPCPLRAKVFFLLPGEVIPHIFDLAPTSARVARQYVVSVGTGGTPYYGFVTEIGLSKTKNKGGVVYSIATFKAIKPLDAETTEQARDYNQFIASLAGKAPAVAEKVED